jgi:hypothetical protein
LLPQALKEAGNDALLVDTNENVTADPDSVHRPATSPFPQCVPEASFAAVTVED